MKEEKDKAKVTALKVPGAFSLERLAISEKIIAELVRVMNHIHQVNHPYRVWKIILSDYVNALVSIKPILEKEELHRSPYLFALNSHHLPTLKQKLLARLPAVIKHYKSPGTRSRIFKILCSENNIRIVLPEIEAVKNDIGGVTIPIYYPIFPGIGNTAKRERADELAAATTDIFYKNMIKQLPKVYVEYFDRLYHSIPLHNAGQKVFHAHGMPGFYNSLIIAKYLQHGAKLFYYQHGAYYGEMIGHNSHFNESSVADEFRTWGWKIKPNDVPWKAYRMEKFRLQYAPLPLSREYDFLMCYPDIYYANQAFFKEITHYLLQHLDKDKYKRFIARPRPANRMFSHAHKLSFINDSRVTIDSGLGSMAAIKAKCRVVIQFTIPSTSFMECLYVDHPTIGLLDNDQPTDVVKPYYDFFISKGVMHHSFESLVDHLNSVDIDTWWASLVKEPVYQQFKNEFIRKV